MMLACNRVTLSWLEGMYHTYVASKSYVWAARAYLLHLVGNTILANKSLTHVHICYLHYLSDLDCCNEYTWGATTLAFLYDQQSYASKYGNQQMRGYMTLLIVRIVFFFVYIILCFLILYDTNNIFYVLQNRCLSIYQPFLVVRRC